VLLGDVALQRRDKAPFISNLCHSEPLAAGETGESERGNPLHGQKTHVAKMSALDPPQCPQNHFEQFIGSVGAPDRSVLYSLSAMLGVA